MTDQIDRRLSSIEEKLGNVEKALVTLARIEERLSSHVDGMQRLGKRIDDHEDRIRVIERESVGNSYFTRNTERVFWILFTAAINATIWYLK